MAIELGHLPKQNILVKHVKRENPKFRLALMQVDLQSHVDWRQKTSRHKIQANIAKHRDLVEALMAFTKQHQAKPDLIIFQELSVYGGIATPPKLATVEASGPWLTTLNNLAADQQVHIGYGTFRSEEKAIYNSYFVAYPGGNLLCCNKRMVLFPQKISPGPGYLYLANFQGLVSICSDSSDNAKRPLVPPLLIIPASTFAEGVGNYLDIKSLYGLRGQISVINHTGSAHQEADGTRHFLSQGQEEIMLVDVVL